MARPRKGERLADRLSQAGATIKRATFLPEAEPYQPLLDAIVELLTALSKGETGEEIVDIGEVTPGGYDLRQRTQTVDRRTLSGGR